jgi:hypothetical protein
VHKCFYERCIPDKTVVVGRLVAVSSPAIHFQVGGKLYIARKRIVASQTVVKVANTERLKIAVQTFRVMNIYISYESYAQTIFLYSEFYTIGKIEVTHFAYAVTLNGV